MWNWCEEFQFLMMMRMARQYREQLDFCIHQKLNEGQRGVKKVYAIDVIEMKSLHRLMKS